MVNAQPYWKQKPVEPWSDWRTYSMLVPIIFSAIGACVFTVLAFSFTEVDGLPEVFLTRLVIVGAFAVGIGSTFGSVASGIEIFRKQASDSAGTWDWIALGVSTGATVGGYGLGFAALLGAMAQWSRVAQVWGPLVLGTLVALDALGDIVEIGGLFGSYELRMETWLEEYAEWAKKTGYAEPVALKPATMTDLRVTVGKMNGDWADPAAPTVQQLAEALRLDGYEFSSESTGTRWARLVRNGKVN